MPQPPHPDRDAALAEIVRCIAEHGREAGPKIARDQFTHVHPATWCRWVSELVGNSGGSRTKVCGPLMKSISEQTATTGPLSPEKFAEMLPVPNFLEELETLRADVQLLRDFATKEGGRSVKLPTFFVQQLRAKFELTKLIIQHASVAYDHERQQRFYDSIIREIEAESPECARRIVVRLGRLRAAVSRQESNSA